MALLHGLGHGLGFGGAVRGVATGKPVSSAAPRVSGIQTVGQTFTTTTGAWTQFPTSYAYKWQTSADGSTGWTDISLATASTYLEVSGDATKYLRSGVQATNSFGADVAGYVFSAAVGPIAAALSISGTPGGGTVGSAYSFTPTLAGGHTAYVVTLLSGSIPAGTSLTSSTGVISGTPTTAATYSFTLRVTDADGLTADLPTSITVDTPGTGGVIGFDWSDPNQSIFRL